MTARLKNDPWPAQWMIVTKKDRKILATLESGRLHVYASRQDARDFLAACNGNRRMLAVVRVAIGTKP